jgi:hypothetical protein
MRESLKLLAKISTLILFVFVCALKVHAQSYPVQANIALAPPYSPFLSDYTAVGAQVFSSTLYLRDSRIDSYQVKLRLTIEGVGITIRTKANFIPLRPITLYGGESITMFGEELEEYFDPNNLDFAGISRSQYEKGAKLPEGVYRFTLEVLDYNRSTLVSNKGTAVAWIILNDPPLLNLPRTDTKVKIIDPTNIVFTWSPRHTASPNSAFTSEYVFKLVEIWPASRNPYDAFLSQQPLYETTTSFTQIVYGPAEPALIPGRKYAWQVQAKDTEGRDLFKNQGKSEVYVFQFGDAMGAPQNFRKDAGSNSSVLNLRWEPASDGAIPDQYRVRYRKKGDTRGVWYESVTPQLWSPIPGLKPDTEYEMQIRSEAAFQYSEYSPLQTFRTEVQGTAEYTCGADDVVAPITNTNLLLALTSGEVITARNFKLLITQVTGSGGNYTGTGWLKVPWFNGAGIRVNFSGPVNTDHILIGGSVESVYNQGSPAAQAIDDANNIGKDTNQFFKKKDSAAAIVKPDYTIPGTIASINIKDDGKITVVDTEGNESTFESKKDEKTGKAKDTVIADAAGNSYTVGADGKVSKNPSSGTNTNNSNNVQPDPIGDRIIVLLMQDFKSRMNAWLRNNGKGGEEDDDVLLAADLPSCFPKDADAIISLRDNKVDYYEKSPAELRGKLIENRAENAQLFEGFKNLFSNVDDVDLAKLPAEKSEQLSDDACNAIIEGMPLTDPMEAIIHAKVKQAYEASGGKLKALLYCKECKISQEAWEKELGGSVIVVRGKSKVCLLLLFNVNGNEVSITAQKLTPDNTLSTDQLKAILPVLGSNSEQTLGFFNFQNQLTNCTGYLDQNFFSKYDYCASKPGDVIDQALVDNLVTSISKCINDAQQLTTNGDGIISDEIIEAVDKTLANRLGDERFKVVFTAGSNSDNTAKKKELGEQTNPTVTISYTKVADKEWKISATLSEEYKKKLAAMPYFKRYHGNVLDDIIAAIDEAMLNSQVKFCGSKDIGANCVSEELRFLQVLCLNIESVGQTGVVHESMWHATDPKRDLLPPKAKWNAATGGVVDELVEEATSIPMLVKTIVEVYNDDEKQEQLKGLFSEKGYYQMQNAVFAGFGSMLGDDSDVRYYKAARYTVMLAFLYYSIAEGVSKSLDDALQQAAELTSKVENAPALRNYLADIAKLQKKGVSQTKQLKELVDEIGVDKLEAIVKSVELEKTKDLLDDLANNRTLREALVEQSDLATTWKKIVDFPNVRKDVDFLKSYSKALGDQDMINPPINIESRIKQWITDAHLKCRTCTTGSEPFLDEVLENLYSFKTFASKPGAIKVIENISNSTKSAEGANWLMKLTKDRTLSPSAFEEIVTDGRNFTADIVEGSGLNKKYFECKSWDTSMKGLFTTGKTNFGAQFCNYLNDADINSLNQFSFHFNPSKWTPNAAELNSALKASARLFKTDVNSWGRYKRLFGSDVDDLAIGDVDGLIEIITQQYFTRVINPVQ